MKRRAWLAGAWALASAAAGAAPRAPQLGFALGSGSIHGLAHVGIVRACEAARVQPQVIAGTSAGAAVGVLWAAGLDADRIESEALAMDWDQASRWVLPWKGLHSNRGLQDAIDRALGGRTIESLPRRFAAVATDVASGDPVLLRSGPAGRAVAASSAVPVWFEPVRVDGRDLVDGSLSAPVPVDAARALGAELVVAVDVAYRPHEQPTRNLGELAFQSQHILVNALAREQTARADLLIRLDLHHLMAQRFEPQRVIEAGERAMRELLPELRRRLAG